MSFSTAIMSTKIQPLPEDVIRRLRSSATITSLNAVVCGLVKNSLDAGATRINITVDYSRGNCSVEDDGQGILPLEFRDAGGLGKQHHTSRHSPGDECHGANGNFLTSLAALSLLSITSHHHLYNSQNTLVIHNSRVLARNIPALPEQRLVTFSHGTRVMIRDLFGAMAVRVKQRSVASEKSAVDKEWGRLVHDVAALLLAWPAGVALFVRDTVNNNETRFRPNPTSTSDVMAHSSRILAQSGLVDSLDQVSWTPIGASVGKLTIEGCISLNPVATRRAQFISLGIHPVTNEYGTNVLYNEVNRVFVNSGFATDEDVAMSSDPRYATFSTLKKPSDRIARPRRGLDRWPMFYFRIASASKVRPLLNSSVEDFLEDRSHVLADMIDLLKLVCYEFLKKYHFRPRKITTSILGSSSQKPEDVEVVDTEWAKTDNRRPRPASLISSRSTSAPPVSKPDSPFDLWQRVKVGRVSQGMGKHGASTPVSHEVIRMGNSVPVVEEDPDERIAVQPSLRFLDESGNLLRKPFGDLEQSCRPKNDGLEAHDDSHTESGVTGPGRGLEPRTSAPNIANNDQQTAYPTKHADSGQAESSNDAEPVSSSQFFKDKDAQSTAEPSKWLKGLLATWENPVFQPAETPIPRLDDAKLGGIDEGAINSLDLDSIGCSHGTHASSIKLSGRISKAALVGAEVVSQVDRKFILVKLGRDGISGGQTYTLQTNSVLVLIDQHAADERCRLESLMRDYFHLIAGSKEMVARTEVLEKPLSFEFSAKECTLLRKFLYHLRRWGIFYKVEELQPNQWRHNSKQLSKVEVVSLPPSILERCRSEPRLLADLLRQEIWRAEEESKPPAKSFVPTNGNAGNEVDWVSNFHGCPQGVLDLLNSRSCRSAIMFNDILSKHECKDLLRRLSECAFPFQCAHGRPSMVPIIDMSSLAMKQETQSEGFGNRLRKSGLMK